MSYPPDFGFEVQLRRVIVDEVSSFTEIPTIVDNDPDFVPFLTNYNSYRNYLRNIIPSEDSSAFIDLLVLYEILLRQKAVLGQLNDPKGALPLLLGLFQKFALNLEKPISEFIQDQTKEVLDKLKNYEDRLTKLYDDDLKDGFAGLPDTHKKVDAIHKKIVKDPTDIAAIEKIVQASEGRVKSAIGDLQSHFDAALDTARKDAVKYADQTKKDVIKEVCEEVPNRVVGESYFRYNSTSSFYPTLSLIFLEETENNAPRRAQMRIKIDKTSEEIDQAFIDHIKRTLESEYNKGFEYGAVRACYVSSDKRFKNTMFVKTKQDAVNTLKALYELVGLPFDINNLSVTEGRNRKPITRRTRALAGVQPLVQDYQANFRVNLYRVVIQVNGLEKPVLIYKNYEI